MRKYILPCLLLLVIMYCCHNERKLPDISGIEVNVKVSRFEKEIFQMNLDSIASQIPVLRQKYGEFFDIFNHKIIQIGGDNESGYPDLLKAYLTNYSVNQLYNKCLEVYADTRFLEYGLNNAFRYYKYYFPLKPIPHVVTFIGGFNQTIIVSENYLGVALDKYLGRDCDLYLQVSPPIPAYLRNRMYKGKMISDCMRGMMMTEFEKPDSARMLIHNMIYNGKILYLVKSLMPAESDSVLLGYSDNQINWLLKNEKNIWTFLVERKLLFSTDQVMIRKFIEEAPYTKNLTHDSPGQAGVWIGWRIVMEYMKKNPAVSLADLMNNQDYLKILEESRYDP